MQRQRFLFPALALLTVWRLVLLPTCELSPGEAMSAVAAAQPGWTWSGTSPVLTLLAKIGLLVSGNSEYGVRLFAPLLAFAASLLTFRLAKEWFDEQTAAWSVVILNVIPAFNLAAIYLTPGSVAFAGYAALALCLTVALKRSGKWHRAWLGAAACVLVLAFAEGGNLVALLAVGCALWITPGARQRLVQPEFWLVVGAWAVGIVTWAIWWNANTWHDVDLAEWQPDWRIVPAVFRWLLLASPMVVYVLVREWRRIRSGRGGDASVSFLIGLAIPLMCADLARGACRAWPDVGYAAWLLPVVVMLAHHTRQMMSVSLEAKVSIRTAIIGLAAAQSLLLMRTDLLRNAGMPWEFAQRADERRTYSRFVSADPAGAMNGWRETAKIVRQVMDSDPTSKWRLVTDHWQLAAPISFYASHDVEVVERFLENGMAGGNALFITDDERCKAVPEKLAQSFEKTKVVSIAEIMHGGHQVRTVKIFACLHYHAPDL